MNKKLAVITLFCLAVFTIFGQTALSERAQVVLDDPSLSEEKRLDSLLVVLDSSGHYEEAIPILRHQLYSFVAKIKDKPFRDRMCTRYYTALTTCYNKTGDMETACAVADSILIYTERIDDTHWEKAEGFFTYGILQHTAGNQVSQGQDYIAKALQIYESLSGYEERQSNCLYHLAIPYLAANDHEGMEKVVNRLETLARKTGSNDIRFQLYSLKQAYYGDLSTRNPEQEALLDSSVVYSKKTIDLIESYYDELSTVHLPFYNYYNLAVLYLENYGHQTDSARYYLEKAEKWIHIPANADDATIYMDIVTANVYAWAFFYDERYKEAENRMQEALKLMQQVDNNFIIPELSDTYSFFVQLYEKTGRPVLALKYQKLFTENELKR
jgi:tetratricopeptide (TPR) repeat protein